MSKQALVIDTISIRALLQAHEPIASIKGSAVKVHGVYYAPMAFEVPPWFFELDTRLSPRSHCETDESMLQLIPYIVLRNSEGRIFNYFRGGAGEEARLHSRRSVGVGGHVETLPDHRDSLLQHLIEDGQREIEEETGIRAQIHDFCALLVDRTDEVSRVHLGLVAVVDIGDARIVEGAEAGVIDNKAWSTVAELTTDEAWNSLEAWSKLALMVLRQQMTKCTQTLEVVGSQVEPTGDEVQQLRSEFQQVKIRPTVPHHRV